MNLFCLKMKFTKGGLLILCIYSPGHKKRPKENKFFQSMNANIKFRYKSPIMNIIYALKYTKNSYMVLFSFGNSTQ